MTAPHYRDSGGQPIHLSTRQLVLSFLDDDWQGSAWYTTRVVSHMRLIGQPGPTRDQVRGALGTLCRDGYVERCRQDGGMVYRFMESGPVTCQKQRAI